MHRVKGSGLVFLVVVCWVASASACAQDSGHMSSREACRVVTVTLPKAELLTWRGQLARIHQVIISGASVSPSGVTLDAKHGEREEIAYAEMERAQADCRNAFLVGRWCDVDIPTEKRKGQKLHFNLKQISEREVENLAKALDQLIEDAHAGRPVCGGLPADQKAELATFAEKTAAWRALPNKPPLSDEANKQRILAEDALENKKLHAAVDYYESGVAAEPTWAQGWYNAALLHAELKQYSEAAYCMKHYLILMPDAPDSAVAKDKAVLWEAKAEEGDQGTVTPGATKAKSRKRPK